LVDGQESRNRIIQIVGQRRFKGWQDQAPAFIGNKCIHEIVALLSPATFLPSWSYVVAFFRSINLADIPKICRKIPLGFFETSFEIVGRTRCAGNISTAEGTHSPEPEASGSDRDLQR
jgi:hypothetical protein